MIGGEENYLHSAPTNGIILVSGTNILIKADGRLDLFSSDTDAGCEKVFINGKSLKTIIEEEVYLSKYQKLNMDAKQENPLWGKKLSVIGDSEAQEGSYVFNISSRNNMIMNHHAIGGTSMIGHTVPNHMQNISTDADYIIVHTGYNDGPWDSTVADDSMETNTFKGAWNYLLNSLKTNFPNAKKVIMIPYYWRTDGTRPERSAWMKERCKFYLLECFDGT